MAPIILFLHEARLEIPCCSGVLCHGGHADHMPVSVITVGTRHLPSFTSQSSEQLDKVDLFLPL